MGDKSQLGLRVKELIESDVSPGEAQEQAFNEFFIEKPLMAAAIGFMSGGVFATGANAVSDIRTNRRQNSGAPEGLDLQGKSGYNISEKLGNSSYDVYLRMLDEVDSANRAGMHTRDFAESKGVPSTFTDEDATITDKYDVRLQAEGEGESKFTYKNNPMENPKVAIDIVENSKAVYGYSPDPKSERIGKFAEFDWTNKDVVLSAREARLQYHKNNESMYNLVKEMQHKGATIEEIARVANQQRNLNRLQSYIDTDNMAGYEKAVESNIRNFQNELGMTAEQAYNRYGSWYIVLEKAMSANAGMDACCGLYDDFYYLYSLGGK